MNKNIIYNEDCLQTMKKMEDGVIDLTLTSPPYDKMRTSYVALPFEKLHEIASELYRVTKEGGIVVWIIGDQLKNFNESGTSFKHALMFKEIGFNLFDTMIFHKASTGAIGSIYSYWQAFEYMFVFSKGRPKTINLLVDKPNKLAGKITGGNRRKINGEMCKRPGRITAKFGRRSNVWTYQLGAGHSATDKIAHEHPAIFPERLADDHIRSWSNPGDLIYDPFMGSGTVAKVCKKIDREYIGSEIDSEYCDLARRRLETVS